MNDTNTPLTAEDYFGIRIEVHALNISHMIQLAVLGLPRREQAMWSADCAERLLALPGNDDPAGCQEVIHSLRAYAHQQIPFQEYNALRWAKWHAASAFTQAASLQNPLEIANEVANLSATGAPSRGTIQQCDSENAGVYAEQVWQLQRAQWYIEECPLALQHTKVVSYWRRQRSMVLTHHTGLLAVQDRAWDGLKFCDVMPWPGRAEEAAIWEEGRWRLVARWNYVREPGVRVAEVFVQDDHVRLGSGNWVVKLTDSFSTEEALAYLAVQGWAFVNRLTFAPNLLIVKPGAWLDAESTPMGQDQVVEFAEPEFIELMTGRNAADEGATAC